MMRRPKATMANRIRLVLGWIALVAGGVAPLFIPLVWGTTLPLGWKAGISGVLAFGLPEVLIAIAAWLMGAERIRLVWRVCKVWWRRAIHRVRRWRRSARTFS